MAVFGFLPNLSLGSAPSTLLQADSAECGLACLGFVLAHFGRKYDLPAMREAFRPSSNGSTVIDLIATARELKLSARAVKIDLENLDKLPLPAIVHWNLDHFVVLEKIRRGRFLIADPARGRIWVDRREMSECFTGIALELSPEECFERTDLSRSVGFTTLWSGLTGMKRFVGTAILLSLVLQFFVLLGPYYQQLIVDEVLVTRDLALLYALGFGFSLVLMLEVISSFTRKLILISFSSSLSIQMAANLFRHLIRLPLDYFHGRSMGDIVTRFSSLHSIRQTLTAGLVESIVDSIAIVFISVTLLWYSAELAIIAFVSLGLFVLTRFSLLPWQIDASRKEMEARASESANFIETVRGVQTVKIFGAETAREAMWANNYVGLTNRGVTVGFADAIGEAVNRFIFGFGLILTIYVGAKSVLDGELTTGMLIAFLVYAAVFSSKTSRLIETIIQFQMLKVHFDRLGDIILTKREDAVNRDGLRGSIDGAISLRDVRFTYSRADEKVLDGVSFDIKAGESVAIVGRSGCGKSTLMKIMLGLLVPQQGFVEIDGEDLARRSISSYREQVGSVMQDDILLAGSIQDNISFFCPNADLEWVYECARIARIYDYVASLPMGFRCLVGDMGSSLSGGQKQRILLARALYRRPKILFLDEATSNLDVATEKGICESLRGLSITRVIIAHRPETIAMADRVLDLSKIREGVLARP